MIIEITEQFIMGRELKNNSYGHKVLLTISVSGNILFGAIFLLPLFLKRLKRTNFLKCLKKITNYKIVFFTKDFVSVFGCVQEKRDYRAMKISYQLLVLLIIYLFTLGIRIYWLTQKGGLAQAEAIEVALVCSN